MSHEQLGYLKYKQTNKRDPVDPSPKVEEPGDPGSSRAVQGHGTATDAPQLVPMYGSPFKSNLVVHYFHATGSCWEADVICATVWRAILVPGTPEATPGFEAKAKATVSASLSLRLSF